MIDNLMMIDDSVIEQKIYRRIVERSNIVRCYKQFLDPMEALEYLRSEDCIKADAILLDINMPGMNGFEFLEAATKEFGEDFTRAAVIMLTTSVSEKDMDRAKSFSVVRAYVNKPLKREHLEMIENLLASDSA